MIKIILCSFIQGLLFFRFLLWGLEYICILSMEEEKCMNEDVTGHTPSLAEL